MRSNLTASLAIILLATVISSCRHEAEEKVPEPQASSATIQLKTGCWTYYNIKEKSIIGYSLIGNDKEDQEWYGRTDWDVAFSETGIRTNSGTSGVGKGGIRLQPSVPDSLDLSELEEYHYLFTDFIQDTLGVYTEIPL